MDGDNDVNNTNMEDAKPSTHNINNKNYTGRKDGRKHRTKKQKTTPSTPVIVHSNPNAYFEHIFSTPDNNSSSSSNALPHTPPKNAEARSFQGLAYRSPGSSVSIFSFTHTNSFVETILKDFLAESAEDNLTTAELKDVFKTLITNLPVDAPGAIGQHFVELIRATDQAMDFLLQCFYQDRSWRPDVTYFLLHAFVRGATAGLLATSSSSRFGGNQLHQLGFRLNSTLRNVQPG